MKSILIMLLFSIVVSFAQEDSATVTSLSETDSKQIIQERVTSYGSLHIVTNSPTATIFLDGKAIGTDECLVKEIPIGQHDLYVTDGDKTISLQAYVVEGVTRTIKTDFERKNNYLESKDSPIATTYNSKDTEETPVASGKLHIISNSSKAKIYLDGKEIGIAECLVDNIPIGQHEIFILDGEQSTTVQAYVVEGVTRKITANSGRETFVIATTAFSQVWCRGIRAHGPSLDLGLQRNASYYGINFHWDFFNDNWFTNSTRNEKGHGYLAGGAALQWYYTVYNYKEFVEIAPGLASGFWFFDGTFNKTQQPDSLNNPYDYHDDSDSFNEMFFTGPSLRASFGYKKVFLNCAYTMLIGTKIGHALVFGTRVVL